MPVEHDNQRGISRRGLFGSVALTAAGSLAIGAAAGAATSHALAAEQAATAFFGDHQAGIVTPAQDRLHFAAFDVDASLDRAGLISLLQDWTDAAARMTRGEPVAEGGAASGPLIAPPDDTGEALGLPASGLTVTFGFGPGLFTRTGDPFRIAHHRPDPLVDLPHFSGDDITDSISGGDLCIQACADDPQVAVHAIRNLSRIAFGRAALRWSQLGFGRTSSTSTHQKTPRNLFGFKDGTANIKAENDDALSASVWADARDGAPWMAGGSYLVTRKIRMIIETWDRASLGEQQTIIGRSKGEGAPLSGGTEFTEPDFARTVDGAPAIDPHAHVRLAHPDNNGGAQILRRGYNYVDGNDELGRLNAGLFFIAYQRDPRTQFIPLQRALSHNDLLNEYIRHIGSAVFAVPAGTAEGGFVGSSLFSA